MIALLLIACLDPGWVTPDPSAPCRMAALDELRVCRSVCPTETCGCAERWVEAWSRCGGDTGAADAGIR